MRRWTWNSLFLCFLTFFFVVVDVLAQVSGGTITTVAGGAVGDGGPAISAQFGANGLAADADGNVYIADTDNNRIRRVSVAGTITTVAGTGIAGFSGDGTAATGARLNQPEDVAVDAAGNIYIADTGNQRIRRVSPNGMITTLAGTGTIGFAGENVPATQAVFENPAGITVAAGEVYVADTGNARIRKITSDGNIATVAGSGLFGFTGDGGPATAADLRGPSSVAVDTAGNVYFADTDNLRVRKVDTAGIITTVAGTGELGFSGDGGPAVAARLSFSVGIALDDAGNLYIVDPDNNRVRRVSPDGIITTAIGTGTFGSLGDLGPAVAAEIGAPNGVATDPSGNIYALDQASRSVRRVAPSGIITTIAGGQPGFSGDGGPATSAQLAANGVAVDASGNLYISDTGTHRVRRVTPSGTINTTVGTGQAGFGGDGGSAVSAQLNGPQGLAVDASGNLYIADTNNHRIRRVTPSGTITTFAGIDDSDFLGDGGPAIEAALDSPSGVAIGASGSVYIADSGNNRIRRVAANGTISTVAGNGDFEGDVLDGGPAIAARVASPLDVAVDSSGNIYIADTGNNRIRKVSLSGTISTVAGGAVGGFSSPLDSPSAVVVDFSGVVYFADWFHHQIRTVGANSTLPLVAGTGIPGFGGDGGPATAALLNEPQGLALDTLGNLFIADTGNYRVRKVAVPNPGSLTFTVPEEGGLSLISQGAGALVTGYSRIQPVDGATTPTGVAIFGNRVNGILVSEAGVPSSPLVTSGRIYAEVNGGVNTGIAIANPNDTAATINFFFTDADGVDFGSGSFSLGANQQLARFLDQEPFNGGGSVEGTMTFFSTVPISVIALRGLINERGEFLMTTLPIGTLTPGSEDTVYLPRFVDGAGWTTQVILVNPTDGTIRGTVQFLGSGNEISAGEPLVVTLTDGRSDSEFSYSIPPRTSVRLETSNPATFSQGSVRVVRETGHSSPTGLLIFSGNVGSRTFTEAGVPASPASSAFRMYAEVSGSPGASGSIRSGVAVSNTGPTPATVSFELTTLGGDSTGLTASALVPGNGHIATFVDEILPTLVTPFKGVLRVSSATATVATVGLRIRVNQRGEFLITTTAPTDETAVPSTEEFLFPHIVDGGGWTTQFVLFSGASGQSSSGILNFRSNTGEPLGLNLQ